MTWDNLQWSLWVLQLHGLEHAGCLDPPWFVEELLSPEKEIFLFQTTNFWRGHDFTTFYTYHSTTCLLMKFLLKSRCKVSCHLSNSVTSGISYSGMLKKYFPQTVNMQSQEQKLKHFEIITRTILTGSWRNSKTKLTISFKIPSICWWQPSPMAESAIKPACLYFQSATEEQKWSVTHFGNYQEPQTWITLSLQGLGDTGGGRVKNRRWKGS